MAICGPRKELSPAQEADSGEEECRSQPRSISESFLTVKGAALFLPRGNGSSTPRINNRRNKHAGDLQQHLQAMFILLRPEDNIRLAVRLESTYQNRTRYMVVVSTNGRQDTEESIVLGMDFSSNDSSTCTMGLVLPLWSDTLIHLDGDGGFSVSTDNRVHVFKPVSVQAMWSALQSLHKACEVARSHNYYPGSLFLTWVSYYESHINSDQSSVNEWNAMQDVQSHRPDSPALFTDVPTERERTERLIKTKLREIMMQKDLENITSKEIRTELEMQMVCNLREFKEFIDNEMIVILGQMDSPTQIFDHVFLVSTARAGKARGPHRSAGSEWNASNLEDLQNRGVRYILNVTREIDNFFPGVFEYHNIRVYDEEATDLLAYWNDTYKFISKAKKNGSKCLVHCKMGVSRSASTVIAYAMKEYGWNLDRAYDHVKERRTVTKPNPSFMRQLEEYQGILLASKQRHNKLWRSHSDSDLSEHHQPICKPGMELNKKEITTSAEQLSEPTANDNHQPASPVFSVGPHVDRLLQQDTDVIEELGAKERRIRLEFTARDFRAEQIEDELNLNNINGCPAGCCLDESEFPLDNCHSSEALMQLEEPLEMATAFPDLTVDDLETDALKTDLNVHLVPMEEFTACLKDLPRSPDQNSPSPQLSSQPETTDRIDFLSALEKFEELSQESRSHACSHSKMDEQGSGRNGVSKMSVLEVLPAETAVNTQRNNSAGNSPAAPEESSTDEEQPKDISELSTMGPLTRSHSENAISVKEIITEIESINQGVGPCQQKMEGSANHAQAPKRNTVHELSVEVVWASENKPGKAEQSEGACIAQQETAKDFPKPDQESAPTFQPSTCVSDVEESDPAEGQQEPRVQGLNPGSKWCPGSVKRATLEFEERLRQEQEHQHVPPTCLLPTRKNSKTDSAAAELVPKGRTEEPSRELDPARRENESDKARAKSPAAEGALPHGPELPADPQLSPPLAPCLVQPAQESLLAEPGAEQEVLRTMVSLDGSGEPALPCHLPKRIEIIEYTPMGTPPDLHERDGSCEQATLENTAVLLPVDENLNPSVCAETAPVHPDALPLHNPLVLEHKEIGRATFTLGSPEEEYGAALINLDTSSFVGQVTRSPSEGLDDLWHQRVVHLEGITEHSTSTDDEPVAPSSLSRNGHVLCGASDSALMELSNEDLHFISDSTEAMDVSFLPCGLPHSSNSPSIKDLSETPSSVKQRAKELEARVRQAGLTTPSQMKRSASLAKLGCLELSQDDLTKRESASSHASLTCPDLLPASPRTGQGKRGALAEHGLEGPPEKPCASSPLICQDPKPTKHFVEQLKTTECIAQSQPVERPPVQYAKEFCSAPQSVCPSADPRLTSLEEGLPLLQTQVLDSWLPAPSLAGAPRHQHGRTHPLRRLKKANDKKRTSNPFYNTM
ncbi:protein phosphatase Slingshot homolog 2 isoform X3 [Trachemys scripta elegans]|uniref:protein phosphatase Slingshot homolog 2 isoform X3 n=1 Tax=Trachemys scripta elegans TaxID=31138 RepID=UPI001552BD13|nr:protein phosphatase Slingshot homolog 2 isoform X3 [Trachemys scripta elegans]